MKFLKQGLCLALLGAGLAAVPATLASQASASPASSSVASDHCLVQGIRDTASGNVSIAAQRATGQVGFARVAAGGDLLPGVSGTDKAAAAAKADEYLASYGGAFGAGQGELTRSGIAADSAGGFTASYTQSYKGIPVFGALLKAHVNADGALTSVNGYAAPGINVSTDAAGVQGRGRQPSGGPGQDVAGHGQQRRDRQGPGPAGLQQQADGLPDGRHQGRGG